jgi:glucokinase
MQTVFAGVDVGGTRIKIGLADCVGQLLSCEVLDTLAYQDACSFLDAIAGEIRKQSNALAVSITAAGLGCPGRIDFLSGRVA